jgi:hypothetical protein
VIATTRRILLGIVLVACVAGAPSASAAPSFCERRCECDAAPGSEDEIACLARAATCLGERALCEGRLALYAQVMSVVAEGVTTRPLPDRLVDALARFYPRSDLRRVRVGHSANQPAENAITDCTTIYFSSALVVDRIGSASLKSDAEWVWLLHELRHTEQCSILGGRDAYAVGWMEDVPLEPLKRGEVDLEALHRAMPMEADATERAVAIGKELKACCLGEDGRLK